MAKLKNLSLNDSIIFEEESNRGLFTQITTAKGSSLLKYNSKFTAINIFLMPILADVVPLRTSITGLISVRDSGTLYTPNEGDTLTTVNFTDANFSDYSDGSSFLTPIIPRRYALSKYSNISKFPYGILYVYDTNTAILRDAPYYVNYDIPQGVYVVKLNNSGKMILASTFDVSWEVVFDNPFVIPSEVRTNLNDCTVETTGMYSFDSNTRISEYYITHNNGIKELYMRIFLANAGVPATTLWDGGTTNLRLLTIGAYTFSKDNFFTVTPDMSVDMVYSSEGFWPRGLVEPTKTSTGRISFASPTSTTPQSVTCQVHLTQIPGQGV